MTFFHCYSLSVLFLLTTILLLSVHAQDPACSTGLSRKGACCQSQCGKCGGAGCFQRSKALGTRCCPSGILNPKNNVPTCDQSGPPCRIVVPATISSTSTPTSSVSAAISSSLSPSPSSSPSFSSPPSITPSETDPYCETGVAAGRACCRAECTSCGGKGCGRRSRLLKTRCCIGAIMKPENNIPTCDRALPPCKLTRTPFRPKSSSSPTSSSSPSMSSMPSPAMSLEPSTSASATASATVTSTSSSSPSLPPSRSIQPSLTASPTAAVDTPISSTDGEWITAQVMAGSSVLARHEACAVMVNGKVVLIGGRGPKPVSLYDPKTGRWERKSHFDRQRQIHHFQCVAYGGSVWIPSSWTGKFPREENNDVVFEYDVADDVWRTYPGLPEPRRRGGAAAVLIGDLVYIIAGNRGGHGNHATSLPWVDSFNITSKEWTENPIADMPDDGRDHVGAAVMPNGDICVAGGRDGGKKGFFRFNIASVYCYSFSAMEWQKKQDFPQPRAGAMTGTTCDGKLMIAGGEGNGQAYRRVDVFDGETWEQGRDLVEARHGSGLAVSDCSCGHMFVPSGSGSQGGRPELTSTEQWIPDGAAKTCNTY